MLDYLVLYESETGNTKKIATEIFAALPGTSKDLINMHERDIFPEASVYFIGFCVHHGTCSIELGHFLGTLSQKAIALFGTCGAGSVPEYYKSIENSAQIWIEDDNQYLGGFFCQGRMPPQIRQKYETMLRESRPEEEHLIQWQLQNFDEAMIHPDKNDCRQAREFVDICLSRI